MSPTFTEGRDVTVKRPEGGDTEYTIGKHHFDFIYDGVCKMPDSGRLLQALTWFLFGICATAVVEAYDADPGTTHRHTFIVVATAAAIAGAIALFCDWKIKHEGRKHASWVREYMDRIYAAMGDEPPPRAYARRRWRRGGRERDQGREALSAAFEITHAVYGTSTDHVDVTEALRGLIVNRRLAITVDNSTLDGGNDPARGQEKTLWVDYIAEGVRGTNSFREGTNIILP